METKKLTNREVMKLITAIQVLEITSSSLPFGVIYANNKNKKELEHHMGAVNTVRQALLEKHGVKGDKGGFKTEEKDGGSFFVFKSDEDKQTFEDEMKPILDAEVEVKLYAVTPKHFEDIVVDTQKNPFIGIFCDYFVIDEIKK